MFVYLRYGLKILLVLVAGVIVNFAVSCQAVQKAWTPPSPGLLWGPAILTAPRDAWPDGATDWPAPHFTNAELWGYSSKVYALRGTYAPTGFIEAVDAPDAARFWWVVDTGFPFLSFRHTIGQENWYVPIPPAHVPRANTDDGVAILSIRWPVRPIWPGFVLNSLVYGVAVYGACWCAYRLVRWSSGAWRRGRARSSATTTPSGSR